MPTIEQSIDIDAPAGRVWSVLTQSDLVSRWAGAFQPGIQVEADWRLGGEVLWKDGDGKTMMRGEVAAREPGRLLTVVFPPAGDEAAEAFEESYALSPRPGGVRLSIRCGPLDQPTHDMLAALWDDALEILKDLAEDDGSPPPPQDSPEHDRAA